MQVSITEQPENKEEIEDILAYYQAYALNQISVSKMFKTSKEGITHAGVDDVPEYKIGTCKSYGGSFLVQTNGTTLGCCGQFYFYPELRDKVPNIFKSDFSECERVGRDLYLHNPTFINYCKNCSLYAVNNEEVLHKKFIKNGYFAMAYSTQTRYFVIPKPLLALSSDLLLFMYEKGFVSEVKKYLQTKEAKGGV